MRTRRVAVVQAGTYLFDLPRTVDRFVDLLRTAVDGGAELVVFPEAFLGGYPKGATFGATVGERSDGGRTMFARYRRSAVHLAGDAFGQVRAAVAGHRVHVVLGIVERDGHTLYCTAVLLAPDGSILGRHRKLVPTGAERVIWSRGDADDVAVIDSDVGKIGMAICWESYMPLYRTALYTQGVEIYCAPTVDGRDTWTATMRHIAVEGRCFVLSANQFATRSDFPDDFLADSAVGTGEVIIRGGSCVLDPFGRFIAGPSFDTADLLVAELDFDLLDGAYLDLDVVGHYARPDLFGFTAPARSPRSN